MIHIVVVFVDDTGQEDVFLYLVVSVQINVKIYSLTLFVVKIINNNNGYCVVALLKKIRKIIIRCNLECYKCFELDM